MIWKLHRLKDLDADRRAIGVEDERRVAETGAPTGIDQPPVDVALRPTAFKTVELVMVRAAWSQ